MNNAPHVCPLCRGDGQITKRSDTTMRDETETCRACDGKGIVWPPNSEQTAPLVPIPQPYPVPVPMPYEPLWPWRRRVIWGEPVYDMPTITYAGTATTNTAPKTVKTTIHIDGRALSGQAEATA